MTIRQCTAEDAEPIGQLAAEFHSYLRALGDRADFDWDAAKYLRDGFGENAAFEGLVAEVDSKVVAFALYHDGYETDRGQRVIHLIDLFVSEPFRRRGIGKKLMQRIFEIGQIKGAGLVLWSVFKPNAAALRFYEEVGAKYTDGLHFMWCPVRPENRP
jgi:GNAT superfamily N-acetyltransferase